MYGTKAAAEKAAIDGEGQDFNTQQCLALQEDVLSSRPPRHSQIPVASAIEATTRSHSHLCSELPYACGGAEFEDPNTNRDQDEPTIESQWRNIQPLVSTADHPSEKASSAPSTFKVIKNDNGKLKPVDSEGKRSLPLDLHEKVRMEETTADYESMEPPHAEIEEPHTEMKGQLVEIGEQHRTFECANPTVNGIQTVLDGLHTTVDDLTQKSSMPMSLTQENSESAYAKFDIQDIKHGDWVGEAENVGEGSPPTNAGCQDSLLAKHHSVFTDSTAHTYGENDTGHVHFDTIIPVESVEFDQSSQDGSFEPREETMYGQSHGRSFEPQTPAPVINPFFHKGSVMKGHEMFGATQPSSIGRHLTSAASTRPSPNVYNDFSSPAKQMPSSPLPGRIDGQDTSPLQSSVRSLLRTQSIDSPEQQVAIPRASGVQSFDSGPRIQLQNREPRPYVSMQESQERRKREADKFQESDSESDSNSDDLPRKRLLKQQREQEIKRQLSSVRGGKRPTSSRPASSGSGVVEIPSTGRKGRYHSIEDQYLSQCEGRDARDSQQEEVIADSQSMPVERDLVVQASGTSGVVPSWANSAESGTDKSNNPVSPTIPAQLKQNIAQAVGSESKLIEAYSPLKDQSSPLPRPSLPLMEVSTNHNDIRTPIVSRDQFHSDADSTVPETSPAEDRLQPMGAIASISFGEESQMEFNDLPGFSQIDVDFENAIREPSSPDPTSRKKTEPRLYRSTGDSKAAGAPKLPEFPIADIRDRVRTADSFKETTASTGASTEALAAPISEFPLSELALAVGKENDSALNKIRDGEQHVQHVQHVDDDLDENVNMENSTVADDPPKNVQSDEQLNTNFSKANLKRSGLRTKVESKGLSKVLRNTDPKPLKTYSTPRQPTRVAKSSSAVTTSTGRSSRRVPTAGVMSSPLSSLATTPRSETKSSPPRPSARKSTTKAAPEVNGALVSLLTKPQSTKTTRSSALKAQSVSLPTSVSVPTKRSSKRSTAAEEPIQPTRSSKRQSMPKSTRDSSADLLAGGPLTAIDGLHVNTSVALFENMAFAVSYVKQQEEKDNVTRLIKDCGGQILADGFDSLFDFKSGPQINAGDIGLTLSPAATVIGFTALIADEHSRRAKYMQALALGLPCISGRWISRCVSKGELVNWAPYLLCAGQSSFLGNAIRSRTLNPYSAQGANFPDTIMNRDKLLEGKSVLLVTGKGRTAEDKRKAYVFLTLALGPAHLEQVVDYGQARKKLLEAEGHKPWDLLYVDNNVTAAEAAVFGSNPTQSGGSRKRKRGPTVTEDVATMAPKKIRIISDEDVIQSLILGELLD